MKKLTLIIIAISLLLCSLCACSRTKEPVAQSFSLGELNITLTSEFSEAERSDTSLKLISENREIKIVRIALSAITPKEGYDFPTIEEFTVFSGLVGNIVEEDIKTEDGLKIIDYDSDGDGELNRTYTLFETDEAYWAIGFKYNGEISYDTARAQSVEWCKTVTFTPIEG